MNPTPHINRSKVKKTALEYASQVRSKKFTRVGASFLDRIELYVRQKIAHEVSIHPSKGKTLL